VGILGSACRSAAIVAAVVLASCGPAPANGPYSASIASGVQPRLTAEDAIRITRGYLDAQTPEIAAPELHIPPAVTLVWAVRAANAPALDGCIPTGLGERIVWVTKGQGDYLNLHDHLWSKQASGAASDPVLASCEGPGPAGTLVIDDASGEILGVYPEVGLYPHPTPPSK
jgi:hypothetical protein